VKGPVVKHAGEPHEALFERLTLGPADPDPELFLAELVASSTLSEDDRAFLLEQGPKRLLVYRRLVRNTLRETLELAIPRLMARLEGIHPTGAESATPRSLFAEAFDSYCDTRGPRSHYLRDVAAEFLDFFEARFAGDARVPPFLLELGRLEAAQIEIAAAPSRRDLRADGALPEHPHADLAVRREPGVEPRLAPQQVATPDARSASDAELHLARGVRFIEACRLFRFEHAVHRLPEELDDRSVPDRGPTSLLVYRSPEHDVRYLELSPVAEAILRRLIDGSTLETALVQGTAEGGLSLDDSVLAGAAHVLAELAERGVLLGPR
jgi:hypothetical protein